MRYLLLLTLVACTSTQGAKDQHVVTDGESMRHAPLSDLAQTYEKQCHNVLAQAQTRLTALEQLAGAKTVATVLMPLNELWVVLDRGLNTAGLYRNVHPDPDVREVANTCEQEFAKVVTNFGLSRPVYEAVAAVDVRGEDAVTQRYTAHLLRDFRRAGVDKDAATRDKIRALKDELVQIGQAFDKNIREDVRTIELDSADALAGLPDDYISQHKAHAGRKITISTDYPDYLPFMSYAHDDAARKRLYTVFRQRGYPQNVTVLANLLGKRYALAQLLGYTTWASYITEDKMIKSDRAAQDFIDKISHAAEARAKQDYDELLTQLKQQSPRAVAVGDWQKTFIEEQVKRQKYNFDSQAARQYFAFGRVRQGLLDITSKMFGVTYKKIDVPVWHPSVVAYEILSDGKTIGRFFLDLHPRADKYKHAAAFPIRSGVGAVQLPEAALVCNFPEGEDALMEHDEVETFFHEFGHLLHHLFGGAQRWIGVSGISTEWDFVEAPSQMLEEWTFDRTTLHSFARNKAGEVIPDTLLAAMARARDFGKGLWVKHQMFYAAVSLNFHNQDPTHLDPDKLLQNLQSRYSPFAYVPDTHFEMSFGHLEGYSAIYYTYMWSLVIAKDLFSVFRHDGLLNTDVARRYRQKVLEPGGSKDAADLVHDFLGRDFSFDSFATWLNE